MAKKKIAPKKLVSHDDYYMGEAFLTSRRSKDPYKPVGAVIVSSDNHIFISEPNAIPDSIKDDHFSWSRTEKRLYMRSAIERVTWFAARNFLAGDIVDEANLYVTCFPTRTDMRAICDVGIKKVIWFPYHEKSDDKDYIVTEKDIEDVEELAKAGNVKLEKFDGNLNWMRDAAEEWKAAGVFS